MGLLDMLIPGVGSNPFYQAFDQNRGKITGAFGGMVGAGNDPRQALMGFTGGLQHGVGVDQENAIIRQKQAEDAAKIKAQQEQQEQVIQYLQQKAEPVQQPAQPLLTPGANAAPGVPNQTVTMIQQKAASDPRYAELLQGVEAGLISPGDAWLKAMEYDQPAKPQYQVVGDKLVRIDGPKPEVAFDPYAGTGGINPEKAFAREKDVAAQYSGDATVKAYQGIRDAYEKVRSASQLGTGAGDISLIFGYMKMLDQSSTVREGEFATAQQTSGVPQSIVNMYNQAVSGVRLNDQQRKDFIDAATAIYSGASENLAATNEQYTTRAQGWGITPGNFITQPEFYKPLSFGQTTVPPPAAFGTGGGNPYGPSTGNTITLGNGMTLEVY